MTTTTTLLTAEGLLRLPDDGQRYELIAGVLHTMPPTGDEHGGVVVTLAASLHGYVQAHRLGRVRAGEPGYILTRNPDTVRAPDVAFLSRERAGAGGPVRGYREGAPDLVAEVVSPNDRPAGIAEKVATWFRHGARMVLVLDPRPRTVAVYRSPTDVRVLTMADTLGGEEVVPGWRVPVAALFEEADDQ